MSNKRLNWVYTSAQTRQSLQWTYTQRMGVDKGSGQNQGLYSHKVDVNAYL